MPSFRKVKTGWRVELCVKGVRDSATRTTKAEARAWAERREEEIRTGRTPESDKTVADLFAKYGEEVSPKKRGARWEQIRLALLSRMPIGKVRVAELGPDDVARWRDERLEQVSTGSVLRELTLIRHAFEIARKEWSWIEVNPTQDVERPKTPRARNRRPTTDEIDRIVLALGFDAGQPAVTKSQRVAVAYLFAIETAMRAGEICGLLAKHVDLTRRVAHLPLTKNGLERDVPLSTRAVELLEMLRPWDETVFQLDVRSLDTLFRRAKQRCRIEGLTFHDSRAEALTRLSKKVDVMTLARISGHRDLRILLNVYYRPDIKDVVALLD